MFVVTPQETCRNTTGFLNGCGQFADCLYNATVNDSICYHESPFDMTPGVWASYFTMPLFVGIGILGGLGGGILKGPYLEMILNYSQTTATHISYCLMFGSTFLNTILLVFEKKPDEPDKPIINYWIAIIFNLAIPFATNLGSSLLTLLPQIYVLVLSEVFLLIVSPIIWNKAVDQKKRETHGRAQKTVKFAKEKEASINMPLVLKAITLNEIEKVPSPEYLEQEAAAKKLLPLLPLSLIVGSFMLNQIIVLMITTPDYKSYIGVQQCHLGNYMVILLLVLCNLVYTTVAYRIGKRKELFWDSLNFQPEIRYFSNFGTFCKIYAGGFAAGFISGLLGMGAGLIQVPVLISCGLIARCASATSAFNYFVIALNNLITLLINKYLGWQEILLFTFLALLGGSVFAKLGYTLMNRSNVGYIVIYFVFSMAVANILSQAYYGVVTAERYGISTLTKSTWTC